MAKGTLGRKPAHLTASGPRPQGRDVMWEAIRALREFSICDLEDRTRIREATIRTYVMGLERAGYLQRIAGTQRDTDTAGRYVRNRWRLERDVGVEAPRVRRDGTEVTQGRGREQLWRTMRIIGEFSYVDLAVNASTETHPVSQEDARHYIKYLVRARYLAVVDQGGPGRLARYRLLPTRYTGAQPPMIQRVRQVFDPNLGKVVWPFEEEEEEQS